MSQASALQFFQLGKQQLLATATAGIGVTGQIK
jgi:hypothetical protein